MVGLVPAAFLGMDTDMLLQRAGLMADACGPAVPAPEHPAVALATAMAAGFASGRDKLTVWASQPIASFTLWLEQLVAESLGKDAKGVIPVVGEPILADDLYGDDRVFVKLSLAGNERMDSKMDAALDRLGERGHPTLVIDLEDTYDLGAQFVLWELATALAGALMGVQPFDQPDVEEAKVEARKALERYREDLIEPDVGPCASVSELVKQARPGDYVAIMAFVDPKPEAERALTALRKKITEESGLATTLGFGPRFLHSTGQLHKGGTNNVLCLQLVSEGQDLEVPGAGYTFGVLADAQAAGDLAALRARGRRVARWCVESREGAWSSPS
jgi:glucose-6-phosphate isomerase/transaldolase/glucose-6-phosphate isomerase